MKIWKRIAAVLLCLCLAVFCSGCAVVKTVKKQVKNIVSFLPFVEAEEEPSPSPFPTTSPSPTPKAAGKPTMPPMRTPVPTEEPDDSFYFIDREDGTAFLIDYDGRGEELVIPEEYEGLTVTSIYEEAFMDNEEIVSVFVPDTITAIGKRAFSGCTSLKVIRLPKNLFDIEDEVFFETNLHLIDLPESVTAIGERAFEGCEELREIVVPKNTLIILSRAFARCKKLDEITIPPSVTRIDDDAFVGCDDLTIYGYTGSAAEQHANEHGIPFVSIGGSPTPSPTPVPTAKPETPSNNGSGEVNLPAGVINKAITLTSDWSNQITLYPDRTFRLYVNLYEGFGSVYGTYQPQSSVYQFSVTDRDFYGFIGDDVWQFQMTVNGNTLTYSGSQIGMVETGYCFR